GTPTRLTPLPAANNCPRTLKRRRNHGLFQGNAQIWRARGGVCQNRQHVAAARDRFPVHLPGSRHLPFMPPPGAIPDHPCPTDEFHAPGGGGCVMARARNIKPGLYKNEDLAECSLAARLLFP